MSQIKKIYKIKLNLDKYTDFYVIGSSFNDAEQKILKQKLEEKKQKEVNIFTSDGSLNQEVINPTTEQELIVIEITMLSDKLLE